MNKFCAAAIQMPTVEDKMENIKAVRHYLEQIKAQNVDFVVLPEMFCCPYPVSYTHLTLPTTERV